MKKALILLILNIFTLSFFAPTITKRPVIYIDPGHGGEDGGATVGDVVEKDINLAISLKLYEILSYEGYECLLTRDSDIDLASDNSLNRKREDIRKRVNLINSSDANLFISIHMNKFPDSMYYGAQTFYSDINDKSKDLSFIMQKNLKMYLNTNRCEKTINDIYLLDHVTKPGCIVECGFMSNPNELSLLINPTYQEKIAYTIAYGVEEYMTK